MYPYRSKLQIVNSFTFSTFPSFTWLHAGSFNWLPGQRWHYSNCHPAFAFIMHECLYFVHFCVQRKTRGVGEMRAGAVTYQENPRERRQWFTVWQDTHCFQLRVSWHVITHRLLVLLLSLSFCIFKAQKALFSCLFHQYLCLCKDFRGVWFGAMAKISWNNINGNYMHMTVLEGFEQLVIWPLFYTELIW